MNALENVGVELLLQLLHRHAHDVGLAAGMHAHIVAGGIDPFDLLLRHPGCSAAVPDREPRTVLLLDLVDAARRQLPHAADRLPGDLADQAQQRLLVFQRLLAFAVAPHPLQRLGQALVLDRFQQVVEGMRLEGLDRVVVEGGDEDNGRQIAAGQGAQHVEAVHAGHLDIEKHQVGIALPDDLQCFAPVGGLGNDLDVTDIAQAVPETAPGE